MKNVYDYNEYLNEGLFGSKYRKYVDKIYKYLLELDPKLLDYKYVKEYPRYEYIYTFIHKPKISDEIRTIDPLGEEDWGDEKVLKMTLTYVHIRGVFEQYDYTLHIANNKENGIGSKVEITTREGKKLYKLAEKIHDDYTMKIKNAKVDDYLSNL